MNSLIPLLLLPLLASDPTTGVELTRPDTMSIAQLENEYGANVFEPGESGWNPPATAPRDTVLHRWYGVAPLSLNALLWDDANLYDSVTASCTLDFGLKHRDDPSRWTAGLAEYAGVSGNGRVITIRIADDVHWQFPAVDRQDPKYRWLVDLFAAGAPPVTSADVQFTFDMMRNPEAEVRFGGYLEGARINLLDERTYQVIWDEFYAYGIDFALGWPSLLPKFLYSRYEDGRPIEPDDLGRAFTEHWHNMKICGYGPYEFVSMDPNVEIVLRRKEDFTRLRPAIQEIHWRMIDAGEQVVLNLLDGQLDHITFMPDQLRKWVTNAGDDSPFKNGTFKIKPYEKMEYIYLGWNGRKAPFNDRRVRKAMSLAFNRQAFLNNQFGGLGALVDSHVFYRHPHFNTDLVPTPFDLAAASRILDEVGYGDSDGDGVRDRIIDGKKVDLSFSMLLFQESPEFQSVMAIYREDLLSIGVDMKLEPLVWGDLYSRMRSFEFDAYTGNWGLGWNLDFTNMFHSSKIGDGANYVGFKNDEADRLIDAYVNDESADDAKRKEMAWRIQELIDQESPYTFFMRRNRVTAYQPWLEGVNYGVARPQLLSWPWYQK